MRKQKRDRERERERYERVPNEVERTNNNIKANRRAALELK